MNPRSEHKPHPRVLEALPLAEWVIQDPRRLLLPEQSENLARAVIEAHGLQEQLEAMREALTFLRDLHDEHNPRCASLFEPPSRSMECDCELGIIERALRVFSSACVCGEINTRHCPVHAGVSSTESERQ